MLWANIIGIKYKTDFGSGLNQYNLFFAGDIQNVSKMHLKNQHILGYVIYDVPWCSFMFLGYIIFIKIGKCLAIIPSDIFFLPLFFSWDSNYLYMKLLEVVPQLTDALSIFLSSLQSQTTVNSIQCIFHLRQYIFLL